MKNKNTIKNNRTRTE